MKYIVALLIFATSFCFGLNKNINHEKDKITNSLSFTENKGQVCDQNYLPRPDVLFSGSDGKLVYHIKNNGISYQLSKIESWKKQDALPISHSDFSDYNLSETKVADKISIYRIDVKWLNTNSHPQIQTEEVLPGYNNYYMEQCPDGILNVQSYKGIVLKNLYEGINLHYYEKKGCLKYDFVVSPNTDYKKIRLNIDGADISLQNDGSILLKTPFGNVEEGKPIAFQNGKELRSRWKIEGNTLSFDIEGVDSSKELIIDPPTRVWGTYYGGSGNDRSLYSAVDNLGNVLIVGSTTTPGGTAIATSGSHQTTSGGGMSDGFLAKFNSAGVRQWATYYGGSGEDVMRSVAIDNLGNIYAVGNAGPSSGSVIATAGAFQTVFGGAGLDGFIVKFNSSGIRQWGTYYGSSTNDYVWSCSVENSGNIYVSGITTSSGNYFATVGAHQSAHAGGVYDAFLAKFTPAGNRVWSTYYGGPGDDQSYSCVSDNKGNVYLSGFTDNGSAAFTTGGAHQVLFGGIRDGFLVKFDTSGTRIWGTFYGGGSADWGTRCITDTAGNVYLAGHTSGGTPTAIATPGSHQDTYGGGSTDAFCAKFNAAGVRQWGTFYGGAGEDYGFGCITDVAGNVYLCGQTSSSLSAIASSGAYQSTYGGGTYDAFFTKLNPLGGRIWGSYYGGNAVDVAYTCSLDQALNLYMAGYSNSTNTFAISTPGAHQTTFNGSNEGFLAKFDGCGVAVTGSISGTTNFCGSSGSPQTYTVAPISGVSTYNWSFSSGWSGSSTTNSIVINNITVSGYLHVSATNSCGVGPVSALTITVHPVPFVSVNSGTVCSGNSFTLTPSGASTYTFSSGSAIVSPTVNTTYSVTGTNTAGCVSSNTAVSTVTVRPLPTLTVSSSSGTICSGNSVTITASGATTYVMNPGGPGNYHVLYPTANTIYTITGSNGLNCNDTKTINVTVNPSPIIGVTSPTVICSGQVATITASGASGYTLYPGGTIGVTQTVSPLVNTSYTIVGANSFSCSGTKTFSINVNAYPTVTVASSNSLLCIGQTATLNATGASTYTWNTTSNSASIVITPTLTTTFSVTGTSSGCSYLCTYTQSVTSCTRLENLSYNNTNISVFPNPTNGEFTIMIDKTELDMFAEIYNSLGQLMRKEQLLNLQTKINLENKAEGIYFIKITVNNRCVFIKKIIKT